MSKIYLQIEFGTGKAYHYSKVEKEGYDKFENTEGKVSYRKYYNEGIYGVLKEVAIRESNYGDQISVEMIDKDKNTLFLNIPMYNQKGGFSAYAESFIRHIPALENHESYRIYPYAMERDNSEYKTYGISIKVANVLEETCEEDSIAKLSYSYTRDGEKVKGDIPEVKWIEKRGKKTMDSDDKDDYLYEVLTEHAKDLRKGKESSSKEESKQESEQKPTASVGKATQTKESPKSSPKPEPAMATEDDDDDDLPF